MKYFLTFLVILMYTINTYSQRICNYGEYDFVLNTINGVDKTDFLLVKFMNDDQKKPLHIYKYDSLCRLIEVNFTGRGEIFADARSSCNNANNSHYKYSSKLKPKKLEITDEDGTLNAILNYDINGNLKQIKYDAILTVDYEYNINNQIKSITKDNKFYSYFWNKNNKIKRIEIDFLDDKTHQEIKFLYKENKLKEVSHTKVRLGFQLINRLYTYKYEKERVCEVKVKGEQLSDVFYFNYNYDNRDKLIIARKNSGKKYLNHYECYY